MRYSSHEPAPPLGKFIHNFWHFTDAPSHPRQRILPSGTNELVINLREDEVRINDSKQPEGYQRFPGIVVSGAYAGAFDIDPSQNASIMGVHFRPGGAFPFFGAAVAEFANSHLALEVLWGRPAIELRERLCAAATPQKRFQILEETLKARLRWLSEHPAVSLALDIFGPDGRRRFSPSGRQARWAQPATVYPSVYGSSWLDAEALLSRPAFPACPGGRCSSLDAELGPAGAILRLLRPVPPDPRFSGVLRSKTHGLSLPRHQQAIPKCRV